MRVRVGLLPRISLSVLSNVSAAADFCRVISGRMSALSKLAFLQKNSSTFFRLTTFWTIGGAGTGFLSANHG